MAVKSFIILGPVGLPRIEANHLSQHINSKLDLPAKILVSTGHIYKDFYKPNLRRHDTQYNDIRPNDIQHNNKYVTVSITTIGVMLNVVYLQCHAFILLFCQ
jgi:hypothetical protein